MLAQLRSWWHGRSPGHRTYLTLWSVEVPMPVEFRSIYPPERERVVGYRCRGCAWEARRQTC